MDKKGQMFEGMFERVRIEENGAVWGGIRVTDPILKGIVKKHYRKFKYKLEWDEYLGSAMTFTWLQMQNFEGDWDAMLAGEAKERNKLFYAISQFIYKQTMEMANPNSRRIGHDTVMVKIDFESLDREVVFDDFTTTIGETQELESYFAVREYRKTPFTKWLDENQVDILTDNQLDFFVGMRGCLDNSKEEVEGKTGVKQSTVSIRLQKIKKKVEKHWEATKSFEYTYIYEDISEEQEALNTFLDIEDVADVLEQARQEMNNNTKLGDVLIDGLSHKQLQDINGHVHDKKLVYAINSLLIERLSNTELFLENERVLFNTKKEKESEKDFRKHFTYRDEIEEEDNVCRVYKDGELIGELEGKSMTPPPVPSISAYGDALQ